MQAWRLRIIDRQAELSARLEALDALEKIRTRELEQLLASLSTASEGAGDKEKGGGSEGQREGVGVSACDDQSSGEGQGHTGDGATQGGQVAEAEGGTGAGAQGRPRVSHAMCGDGHYSSFLQ
jgi:hypothetical protein